MTVGEAFRLSFDTLLTRHGSAADLQRQTGLSSATMTRLRNGERFATREVLERIRQALGVTPAELFDPDRALAKLGLARTGDGADTWTGDQAAKAHTLVTEASHGIGSGSPSAHEGGVPAMYERADPELYQAMTALWDRLDLKAHVRLVELGQELRNAAGATTAAKRLG
jgi:transcriptional regulator with XRE-family HTH domain